MRRTGFLRTWHEDRGFGFITPSDGGRELFVHISAFPRDGSRPTVGELLSFEVGPGKDGKEQAIRVERRVRGSASDHKHSRTARSGSKRFVSMFVVLLVAAGAFAYFKHQQAERQMPEPQVFAQYQCDGRTRCSQMTSCEEAKFFLANCPGTEMDGDNDGVPCEQQWCTR